ncbi:MAG: YkgJ family cysteine cluster protein [Deltaproteobacteria bacterium]|nr:YkgJ family cysteine cluster protein [Deltaproteobacteria bacterium]
MASEQNPLECRRCGDCCRAGGPALHRRDKELLASGGLLYRHLVTLRAGERVTDNVAGGIRVLGREMVKIRGRAGGAACVLFDEWAKACRLHPARPAECAALFCGDDTALRQMYEKDRLVRADLIHDPGLLDLAREHEARFAWSRVAELAAAAEGRREAAEELLEMVKGDEAARERWVRESRDPREAAFVLGRPLSEGLPGFGIRVLQGPSGPVLALDRSLVPGR